MNIKNKLKTLKRIELCLLEEKEEFLFNREMINEMCNSEQFVFINFYVECNLNNISEIRDELIKNEYTTRLFITNDINTNKLRYFVFGKLKSSQGVYNNHCKNGYIEEDISSVIAISSNEGQDVLTNLDLVKIKEELKQGRNFILFNKDFVI